MFYVPDILCLRRKGKLAGVWLAAILTERALKQSVGRKMVMCINVDIVCDNILSMVNAHGQRNIRFSLYLSSQLLYGATKLLSYQTAMFQDYIFKLQRELRAVDLNKKGKSGSTSKNKTIVEIELPSIPPGVTTVKNLHLQPDLHLMPEADIESIRGAHERMYVGSPTFGELSDDLVDFFLMDVEQTQHIMLHQSDDISKEPMRLVADDSNAPRPWNELSRPPVPQLLGTIDDAHMDESSSVMNLQRLSPGTPKKRESTGPKADTPTKRRRRNLGNDFIAAAGQKPGDIPVPLANLFDDRPMNISMGISDVPMNVTENVPPAMSDQPPIEIPVNVPIDAAIPPENQQNDPTVPENNDLHLETIEITSVTPIRRKRTRKRIDESTKLPRAEYQRRLDNINVDTMPLSIAQIVPEGRRNIPMRKLFQMPSTMFHPIPQRCKSSQLGINWAFGLLQHYIPRTFGPFEAETHYTLEPEVRRAEDSRIQQTTGEISSGLQTAAGLESLHCHKTTDDRSAEALELINEQAQPEIPKEGDEPSVPNLELHDITNEPVVDSNLVDTVSVSKQPQSDVQINMIGAEAKSSDLDPDGFLPPGMRTTVDASRPDNDKRASSVDITDQPVATSPFSSEVSVPSSWTKTNLWAALEDFWSKRAPFNFVTFKELMSPQTTDKRDAAVCFMFLLELSEEKKVKLAQADVDRNIYITKVI